MPPPPLTLLADDERLFFDSVYEFADNEIRPLVREMDEHAKIAPALIEKLFALGVMGIEIPDSYGGGGASFILRFGLESTSMAAELQHRFTERLRLIGRVREQSV